MEKCNVLVVRDLPGGCMDFIKNRVCCCKIHKPLCLLLGERFQPALHICKPIFHIRKPLRVRFLHCQRRSCKDYIRIYTCQITSGIEDGVSPSLSIYDSARQVCIKVWMCLCKNGRTQEKADPFVGLLFWIIPQCRERRLGRGSKWPDQYFRRPGSVQNAGVPLAEPQRLSYHQCR